MRTHSILCLSVLIALSGCAVLQPKKDGGKPEGFGTSRAADLQIVPAADALAVEWGTTAEAWLDVTWAAEQKYAVQLAPAANTPRWLGVELQPAIVNPPGRATLRISPRVGEAHLGTRKLTIEGSAFGLSQPVEVEIAVTVHRQSGEFAPLLAAPVTVECRNICGKVDKFGRLAFYDVLREKGQTCSDQANLPETQRIGTSVWTLAEQGFGFGRTCRVAGVYENTGQLRFVNLGISPAIPRGGMMLSLLGARACWLSPDNTVALVQFPGIIAPYDVLTGMGLAQPCRMSDSPVSATLVGSTLTCGPCTWQIE